VAAKAMLDATGCAGVSIGRGAFYNPWIFRQTRHYLRTGELPPEPPFEERVRVISRHLDLMVEVFGEETGCRMFRKVAAWYAKRLGPAVEFRRRVVTLRTRAEFDEILAAYRTWRARFCDARGELLPQYQPGRADHARDSIPMPKGPIEVW
jgi:tRNA-dihydrouridine synthase